MNAFVLSLLVFLGPDELDEPEALQVVMQEALATISPSVVTIETVGGVRQVHLPANLKKKMTVPERPREGDPDAPERREGEEPDAEPRPEGRTPRYKDEWRKICQMGKTKSGKTKG